MVKRTMWPVARLVAGSHIPDMSKVTTQSKRDPGTPGWKLSVGPATPQNKKYVLLKSF
jgi:hypothetical protein